MTIGQEGCVRMDTKTARPAELKQIVQDVLGTTASDMLLNRVYAILDVKQACIKIERMVGLFVGEDKAQALAKQFREALRD
jgi:tagatose-1,6-bisphosphate aldolase